MIGILSYNIYSDHLNYGAMLHSYAFQEYLNAIGVKSVIVKYKNPEAERHCFRFPFFQRPWIYGSPIQTFRVFSARFLHYGLGALKNLQKYNKFHKFFREYCNITNLTYTYDLLMRGGRIDEVDTYVVESDVTWKLENGMDEIFFLAFPDAKCKRKIAYAPSMGSRPLHNFGVNGLKALEYIKSFDYLSSRDSAGAEYLSLRLGRPVAWVVDPVLLLPKEKWEDLAALPSNKFGRYLLIYNCMINDRRMICQAHEFAKKNGLKVIEVSNYYGNLIRYGHRVVADAGLEEWIGLILNAQIVFCNSYHGMLFSVLFNKEFYCFKRDNKDFRMQSFLEGVGLSSRLIAQEEHVDMSWLNKIKYEAVTPQLEKMKECSFKYIRQAFVAGGQVYKGRKMENDGNLESGS